MTRLKALITCVVLGTSSAVVAEPTIRGGISINLGDPVPQRVVVRNAIQPRGFIRFEDYDDRYDRVERVRVTQDISGVYDSKYGRVTLVQRGNRVTGSYENSAGPGYIKGRLTAGALHYRWKQGANEGKGVWYVKGRRDPVLAGTWGVFDSRDNGGRWRLEPVRVGYRDRYDRRYDRRYDGYRRY